MSKIAKTKEISGGIVPIKDKLISNTIYLFLDWFAVSVMGFLFWLIAGKTLLPVEYGIVSTSINFALILSGLSLFGMHAVVWKLVPEYLVSGQKNKIASLIRFSLENVLIFNVIILLIIFLLSPFLSYILKVPLNAFLMSGFILFSYTLVSMSRYVIYGFQNMKVLAITDSVGYLIKIIASLLLILLGFKYFGPLVGFLVGNIVIVLLRVKFIPLRDKLVKINKRYIVLNYAIPAFIPMTALLIFLNGQYLLLSALKDPQVTGFYTVSMTLSSILAIIPSTLNSALLPITSQLSVRNDTKIRHSRLIGLVFRYSLLITLPLAVFLIVFSKPAILLFSRAEYLQASSFLPLLVLGSVTYGISNIFLDNIYAIGRTKVYRNIVVIASAVFLLLAFPLIYLFSAFGSALAYIVTTVLLVVLSFLYLNKFLDIKLPWRDILKIVVSVIVLFGLLKTLLPLFSKNILLQALLCFAGGLLYLIILVTLRFGSREDVEIINFVIGKLPILNKQIGNLWKSLSKFISKS